MLIHLYVLYFMTKIQWDIVHNILSEGTESYNSYINERDIRSLRRLFSRLNFSF